MSAFQLYPEDRKDEAHELFLDYFYAEEWSSFADRPDEVLHEIELQGSSTGASLKDVMAGRVAAEVGRLRREMSGLTPQALSLRERRLRRSVEGRRISTSLGTIVECEVAFALRCASGYDMTDADYDAEEAALAADVALGDVPGPGEGHATSTPAAPL